MSADRIRNFSEGHYRAKEGWLDEMALFMARRKKKSPAVVAVRDAFAWWAFLKTERKAFVGKNRNRPLTAMTVKGMISAGRRFFSWLVIEEKILLSPFAAIEIARPPKALPRDILRMEEVRRLLEAPDTRTTEGVRDRAVIELLYSTGLRRGEAARLELGDVDLSGARVFVREGKGKKDRVAPLGRIAAEWLRRYLTKIRPRLVTRPTERIWIDDDGEPMDAPALGRLLSRHAKKSGIGREITPHTLRHTFATHMIDGGAPVAAVQRILGHSSIRTTQIYTRVTIRSLRDIYRRTHPSATKNALQAGAAKEYHRPQ